MKFPTTVLLPILWRAFMVSCTRVAEPDAERPRQCALDSPPIYTLLFSSPILFPFSFSFSLAFSCLNLLRTAPPLRSYFRSQPCLTLLSLQSFVVTNLASYSLRCRASSPPTLLRTASATKLLRFQRYFVQPLLQGFVASNLASHSCRCPNFFVSNRSISHVLPSTSRLGTFHARPQDGCAADSSRLSPSTSRLTKVHAPLQQRHTPSAGKTLARPIRDQAQ